MAHRSLGQSVLTDMIQNRLFDHREAVAEEDPDVTRSENSDQFDSVMVNHAIITQPHEGTPLLHNKSDVWARRLSPRTVLRDIRTFKREAKQSIARSRDISLLVLSYVISPKRWDRRSVWKKGVVKPASYLPAVIIGLLLNVLVSSWTVSYRRPLTFSKDALSYGKQLCLTEIQTLIALYSYPPKI